MEIKIDRFSLGQFIRNTRKQLKLNQKDLIDDVISQTTISNIERGNPTTGIDKIIYVLNRLGFDEEVLKKFHLPDERIEEDSLVEEWTLRLTATESIIDLASAEEGADFLRSVNLPSSHPLNAWAEYLRGKIYLRKSNWKKARSHLEQAINMLQQNKISNLESACYHELGLAEYMENRYQSAVEYADEAFRCFDPNGERLYYRDLILISKAIYLEKLNRISEADKTLDMISNHSYSKGAPYSKEAALNKYEMQAKLLAKSERYEDAIQTALAGIELARIDKMVERAFELWVTLGSIYIETNKPYLAEICFRTALKFDDKVKRSYLRAYVYTQLGTLYHRQRNLEKAEDEFKEALLHSRKNNDIYWEVEALTGLGKCLMETNPRKAVEQFHKALELARKHKLEDKKTDLLLLTAQCLIDLKDPQLNQIALDLLYSQLESLKGGEKMLREIAKRHSAGDPPSG